MAQFSNTPPGELLPQPLASELREKFIAKFADTKQRHLPFWFSFPFERAPRETLWSNWLRNKPTMYLLVGKGSRIYGASGDAIASFFMKQLPSEDFDLYVFDDSFDWCIASTHELAPEAAHDADFLVLRSGAGVPTR